MNHRVNSHMDSRRFLRRLKRASVAGCCLVCFPSAGAGASVFRRWAVGVSSDIDLYSIQLPGREDRLSHTPVVDLTDAAVHIADELVQAVDKPLILFGHSMGALLAYETASVLMQVRMQPVAGLILSGHGSPDQDISKKSFKWDVSDEELLDDLRRLDGTPRALLADPAIMSVYLPAIRSDYRLLESYRYRHRPPLSCSLITYSGSEDAEISRASVARWSTFTQRDFCERWFEGNHFYLFDRQDVVIAQLLSDLSLLSENAQRLP